MSIELRYIYGGYQITEPGTKYTARNTQEIDKVTNNLYGFTTGDDVFLVLDNRHFAGYTRKQLLNVEHALLNCISVARELGIELVIAARRELAQEISPRAGLVTRDMIVCEHPVSMTFPHLDIGRSILPPISERVVKAVDDVALGYGNSWIAVRLGRHWQRQAFLPFQMAGSIAELGDLHPMETSDVQIADGRVTYRFEDSHKRVWSLTTPLWTLTYDEAMRHIQDNPQSKRWLEMFYNSTANPVARLSDEVINMLLPWSCRVDVPLPVADITWPEVTAS